MPLNVYPILYCGAHGEEYLTHGKTVSWKGTLQKQRIKLTSDQSHHSNSSGLLR